MVMVGRRQIELMQRLVWPAHSRRVSDAAVGYKRVTALRGQTGAPDAYGPERGSRTILGQDSASLWIGARGGTLTQRWALGYGASRVGRGPRKFL